MTRRAAVFGCSGQLGVELVRELKARDYEVSGWERAAVDISDGEKVERVLAAADPKIVFNAAAYNQVDIAEKEPQAAYVANAMGVRNLALACRQIDAQLIHYSTDYVFDGTKTTPYVEEDATGPRNVYGASKLAGEQGIAEAGGAFIILRTSWVYSNDGANFLKTMLRLRTERPELRIVADQHGAPTSADSIATATVRILTDVGAGKKWTSGVYHMTAGGATSWYGFAKAIFARAGAPTPSLVPIETAEYPTPAARPANSVLSNEKFAAHFGFRLPEWEQQLDAVMAARAAANEPEIHAGT